jgi:hypothetical protein
MLRHPFLALERSGTIMTTTISQFASNPNTELLKVESYRKVLPAILALPQKEVTKINADIARVVPKVLGSLPQIIALRAVIAADLPKFDLANVDNLEDLTLALDYCDAAYTCSCESPDDLAKLAEEAYAIRDTLYGDAMGFARRGLINPASLKDYSGQIGYTNVARDVTKLAYVITEAWTRIEGKCAIEKSELEAADKLATRIQRLAGLRAEGPEAIADSADQRARAFTLFLNAYDQVRRAVQFVRWEEGDADDIAPSLYTGKKRAAVSDKVEPTPAPVPAPVPAPPAAPALGALKAPEAGSDPFLQ